MELGQPQWSAVRLLARGRIGLVGGADDLYDPGQGGSKPV